MSFPSTRPGGAEGIAIGTGDFSELLRRNGNHPATAEIFRTHALTGAASGVPALQTEATTVLSFH